MFNLQPAELTQSPVPSVERVTRPLPPTVGAVPPTFDFGGLHPWLVATWLGGAGVLLLWFAGQVAGVRRLRVEARPCSPRVAGRLRRAASDVGLRKEPLAIVSDQVPTPGAFGLLRPTVILPAAADGWTDERLDAALLHELSHLRRHDYLTHLVAFLVRAVYWINPGVWFAAKRLDRERERACDDGAVVARVDPIRYAEHLMSLAWNGRGKVQPTLSLASRSSLPERVKSLLDRAQTRAPLEPAARMSFGLGALVILLLAGTVEVFGIAKSQDPVLRGLADPDPVERRKAAWVLGEAESLAGVDALVEALGDEDPGVRAVSAWALGEIKDPRAIDALAALLSDPSPRVREMAVLAIGEVEDPAGLDVLVGAGPASEAEARDWAVAEIRSQGEGPEVFAGALHHPRAVASRIPAYLAQLGDPDPGVRALAAESLGILGAAEAVDPLLAALDDPDASVRAAIIWALDEINPSRRES